MAYTFFPESVSQIETKLKFPAKNKEEIKRLWSVLNKKFKVKAPINLDLGEYKIVNVIRALQGTADLGQIKREAKLNILKIKFGNGSLGGRGVQNKNKTFGIFGFPPFFDCRDEKERLLDKGRSKYSR